MSRAESDARARRARGPEYAEDGHDERRTDDGEDARNGNADRIHMALDVRREREVESDERRTIEHGIEERVRDPNGPGA